MNMDANPFALAEFVENPEPRCPCRWHRTAPVPGTTSGIVAVPGIRHHPAQ